MRDRLPVILSTTALLVALFGATPLGEAAFDAVVPKNSVGAQQLRNGAVTNAKLRGDAVTSGKVKNRSLKAIDFMLGQLPSGPAGPKGDKGEKGEKGEKGDQGVAGLSGYEVVRVGPVTVNANTLYASVVAKCPAGKKVLGGIASAGASPNVFFSEGIGQVNGEDIYGAAVRNAGATPVNVYVTATCGTVAP